MKNVDGPYNRYAAASSAGVDCGGFLMRAASYPVNGNKFYEIGVPDDSKRDIMVPAAPNSWENYPQNAAYPDWFGTTGRSFITVSWHVDNINTLIPGDYILVKKINNDGTIYKHVAYVFKIEYKEGTRTMENKNIILIEASTWTKRLVIFNDHTYQDFNTYNAYTDKLRRLKPVK